MPEQQPPNLRNIHLALNSILHGMEIKTVFFIMADNSRPTLLEGSLSPLMSHSAPCTFFLTMLAKLGEDPAPAVSTDEDEGDADGGGVVDEASSSSAGTRSGNSRIACRTFLSKERVQMHSAAVACSFWSLCLSMAVRSPSTPSSRI